MKKTLALTTTIIIAANSIFAQTGSTPSEPKLKTYSQDTIYVEDPKSPGNMFMKVGQRKDYFTFSGYGHYAEIDSLDLPKLKELQTTLKNTKILSYEIGGFKNEDYFSFHIVGSEITKGAKDFILKRTKDTKIVIDEILVLQEGKQKQVEPIILKVKK